MAESLNNATGERIAGPEPRPAEFADQGMRPEIPTRRADSLPTDAVTPTSKTLRIAAQISPELLDVNAVAELLDCSARHVYRLSDAGKMPAPLRLGALVRWQRKAVLDWIVGGCKPVRRIGGLR